MRNQAAELQSIQNRLRSLRVNLAHKTLAEIEGALGNEIARLGKVIGELATEELARGAAS